MGFANRASRIQGGFIMKHWKVIRRSLVLALIVAMIAATMPIVAMASKSNSYYCIGDRVNVRVGPHSYETSIGKLRKGDVVTYISASNGWYRVAFYKKSTNSVEKGYVYRKFLKPVTSSKSSNSKSSVGLTSTLYKTTVNLRVRSEPSITEGYVKKKLRKGTKVAVVKQKRSWVYVTYKGGSGWVSAKYLKKVSK